jgi:TonB family protein
MFQTTRYETADSLQIKLPWDTFTARGFGIALVLTFIFLLLAPSLHLKEPKVRNADLNTIPVTLLNFGNGDGAGISKGNLTPEGAKIQGPESSNVLEDAQKKAITKSTDNSALTDELSDKLKTVASLSSNDANNKDNNGSDSKNVGSSTGSPNGTGLGDKGYGKGAGSGFGDIEWGGGGNRTVLHKPLPVFPSGVRNSASIKLQFKVLPDGTVSQVIPLQKADPRLEKAAIEALRRWRFNPLNDDRIMVGVIPLSFILR